ARPIQPALTDNGKIDRPADSREASRPIVSQPRPATRRRGRRADGVGSVAQPAWVGATGGAGRADGQRLATHALAAGHTGLLAPVDVEQRHQSTAPAATRATSRTESSIH